MNLTISDIALATIAVVAVDRPVRRMGLTSTTTEATTASPNGATGHGTTTSHKEAP